MTEFLKLITKLQLWFAVFTSKLMSVPLH